MKDENTEASPPKVVNAEEIRFNLKATTVTLCFSEEIPNDAKTILLHIKYTGFLNNQMAGKYSKIRKKIERNEGELEILIHCFHPLTTFHFHCIPTLF